mmetsp:Transcript_96193/g.272092  ORF Transcript_96193/g.272092 Transcript_96193/m.272092 type:complete len:448 (+) Transcript_96193:87-1430(+)
MGRACHWALCLLAERAASLALDAASSPREAEVDSSEERLPVVDGDGREVLPTAEEPLARPATAEMALDATRSRHRDLLEHLAALQANATFSPAQYQEFIDFFPVTRFNNLDPFHRYTDEAGRHDFPASTATRLPGVMDRFDWTIMGGERFEHKKVSDPHTVWIGSSLLGMVMKEMQKWDPNRTDRVLVMNGDAWLSEVFGPPGRNPNEFEPVDQRVVEVYNQRREKIRPRVEEKVRQLRNYFGRIFFEAKDMDVQGVETMPIGFTEFFLRNGVAEHAAAAVASASLENKPGDVKGSFSFYHDLANCQRGWGEGQWLRLQAKEWSRTAAARAGGVDSDPVEPADWWSTIARFKFLMTPNGCGVQTPKQTEALWVLTVPLARRGPYSAYDDLVRYGFPMVVVNEWDEITPSNTREWWARLSPRLVSFRENCLTSEAYWRFFTGQGTRCE